MQKITKNTICILLIIATAIGISLLIGTQVAKEERQKNSKNIDSIYGNIVYAFSLKKEKDLVKVATNVIRNDIIYIYRDNKMDTDRYTYLCPMLNNLFKNLILDTLNEEAKEYTDKNTTVNFKQEKEDFISGYEKLLNFCGKVNKIK